MTPLRVAVILLMGAKSNPRSIGFLPSTLKKRRLELYDRLFTKEDPEEGEEGFLACLNPNSLTISTGYVEPSLASPKAGDRFQFERQRILLRRRGYHT